MATIGSLILRLETRSERLEAGLKKAQADLKRTHAEMAKLGASTAGIERQVSSGFQRMGASMAGLQVVGHRATQMLTAFATAVATIGIGRLVQQSLALGDNLADMAQQVNVSVEALQRLQFVAEQNGGTADLLDRALNVLNERLGETITGSTEAQQAFANLGLRWQDLQGMKTEDVFGLIADALERFPEGAERASRQAAIFGSRSRALANMLALGSDELRKQGEELDRFGGVLTTQMVQKLASANDAVMKLARVMNGQLARVVVSLTPNILDAVDSLLRMISAVTGNRTELARLTSLESVLVSFFQTVAKGVERVRGAFASATEWVQKFIATSEMKPAVDQLRDVTMQVNQLRQSLEVLNRMPSDQAAAGIGKIEERLRHLLPIQQELEQSIARHTEPRRPFAGPGMEGAESRGATLPNAPREKPAILDPFKVDTAPRGKKLEDDMHALERWAEAMRAAGQPVDILQEKISLLGTIIKEKLSKNIAPASAEIQGLIQQMVGLQQQVVAQKTLTALAEDAQRASDAFTSWSGAISTMEQDIRRLEPLAQIERDLAKQLEQLEQHVAVFGTSSETAGQRVDLYRQALERALAEGIAPYDEGLQRILARYKELAASTEFADAVARNTLAANRAKHANEELLRSQGHDLEAQFASPREQLRETQADLEAMQRVMGARFQPTFDKALRQAQIEFARTTVVGQGLTIVAEGITEAFDEMARGIAQGTLDAAAAVKNMAVSIASTISKLLIQRGIELLLGAALAGIAPRTATPTSPSAVGGLGGGAAVTFQHGGLIRGSRSAVPDSMIARVTPGEYVIRREAVDRLGVAALDRLNALPAFQTGGLVSPPVPPLRGGAGTLTARTTMADKPVSIYNVIVRSEAEAQQKTTELQQMEGAIVNVVNRQLLAGDGSVLNRSIRMVHGGRR